ncbi:type IV pili methyl-accepting chemotaxis transducer N-terminal domain-containing protein [Tengunoibacter tsumagoiensis]|uniref:NarX-like N-terminal domain-containing protein n=1 Tax=Tengunoibacter tsumagoiensis TaxID=2014871 RepID=A0A402A6X0_9CHLR|nr:type IV pili methyl-accepting chemotaxis transducer N-terminal domain-containing protein [Tengunoibacter tsumagoiensis]GCE14839.1 hypothetical protein KTT_46980 [Tengunoibacter tsumagoiensis]
MLHPKLFRTFARFTKILLLLLLIGFEWIPNLSGGDAHYINEAGLQRARSQMLASATYILAYRPLPEHAQAMHDLQTILSVFEHEQSTLQGNPASDVQDQLLQANSDYLPLVTALQDIVAHPQRAINLLEVNIIALHERGYLVSMNALVLILPRHLEERNIQLFVIQIILEILFLFMFFLAMTTFFWEIGRYGEGRIAGRLMNALPIAFFARRLMIVILILVLVGLEIIPLGVGNEMASFNQAALQRTRCEVLAKSALILAYRPQSERTAALSDIQTILPIFVQEQTTLLRDGDNEVRRAAQQATKEYQIMSAASQSLIRESDGPIDGAIVTTLVSHQSQCFIQMDAIVTALQNKIDYQANQIFLVEILIEGTLIIFFIVLLFFSRDPFVPDELRKERK